MRTIKAEEITRRVATLCIEANTCLPADVKAALEKAREEEPWPLAKQTLGLLRSNLDVAAAKESFLFMKTSFAQRKHLPLGIGNRYSRSVSCLESSRTISSSVVRSAVTDGGSASRRTSASAA